MPLSLRNQSEHRESLQAEIARLQRELMPPERLRARIEGEWRARSLLENHLGTFDEQTLRQFFHEVNTDWVKGKIHHNRFGTAFSAPQVNRMLANISALNEWTERIWNAPEEKLDYVLDDFWQRNEIAGTGSGFPTLLLYLKDPFGFSIWLRVLVEGLARVTEYRHRTFRSAWDYRQYNAVVQTFRTDHNLPPQAVDLILWKVARGTGILPSKKKKGKREREEPGEAIVQEPGAVFRSSPASETSFTDDAFDLLRQLHSSPTKKVYLAQKEKFREQLEEPFKWLVQDVAARLPGAVLDRVETEKQVVGKILKNDYGKGGAWDFYWGAFYPEGGKRTEDAQLFIWMNHDQLRFGFYIGERAAQKRKRFLRNCRKHKSELRELLADRFAAESFIFGESEDAANAPALAFAEWLADPAKHGIEVARLLPREEVLHRHASDLAAEIARTFALLFPFVLLATSDDPLPEIRNYLRDENRIGEREKEEKEERIAGELSHEVKRFEVNPPYPLEECSAETSFDLDTLSRWVDAIERKKQAIFYGPPGTGKTFIAEKLARHIIGGGNGFRDLVQFHPAYSYEDFVLGIRPESREGVLHYPLVPGRFLQFCEKAASRTGPCVLVIDEINRANLPRVFGELMYLLEYRDREIVLAGGRRFGIPANVRIIGTMNTADRSIALVDYALRRRFAFIELRPNFEALRRFHQGRTDAQLIERLIALLQRMNVEIDDPHYEVGISYFMVDNLATLLPAIWRTEIEPYLQEYFFDRPGKAEGFRWENVQEQFTVG
jgi:5-methylcytosine-specific restriction protein B